MADAIQFLETPERRLISASTEDDVPFRYILGRPSALAVNLALGAGRPLLVRGEPGTGKSALARAVSIALNRAYVSAVLDAQTEARDLFWMIDTVARLAEAQVQGALATATEESVRERLDVRRFLAPGALWWGFDWKTARAQAERVKVEIPETPSDWSPSKGVVVLLDEIDKADPSVPNSLLEAFGAGRFIGPPGDKSIRRIHRPLVVLTTNEERSLPDAFLRRCVVLQLKLPKDEEALKAYLISRGEAHFSHVEPDLLARAADLLVADRSRYEHQGLLPPGVAEYIDLIRAVVAQRSAPEDQLALLEEVAQFALQKHPTDS